MTLSEILEKNTKVQNLISGMPVEIQTRLIVKKISSGIRLVQKDEILENIYLFCSGRMVVINEFENGHLFRFSEVGSLNFIGEVEFLANEERAACTVESLTECELLQISREDFKKWFHVDANLSRFLAESVACKLYPTSYRNGEVVFYPGIYQMSVFVVRAYEKGRTTIFESRQGIAEKSGISIRTVNRSIKALKEQGLIDVQGGRIQLSSSQYKKLKEYTEYLKCIELHR